MVTEQPLTAEQLIVKHLDENGQKMNWLAKKIDVTVGHLYCVLKGKDNVKRELTDANRNKINEVLGTNY